MKFSLLSEEMSDRSLAEVYYLVLNDVYWVQSIDILTDEAIANLREKLLECGYQKGLKKVSICMVGIFSGNS